LTTRHCPGANAEVKLAPQFHNGVQ